jgi:hypothetical protein
MLLHVRTVCRLLTLRIWVLATASLLIDRFDRL